MPVKYYIEYKGQRYDVGTRFKFRAYAWGYYQGIKEGVIEQFIGTTAIIRADDGESYDCSTIADWWPKEKIVEITHPVYYVDKIPQGNSRGYLPDWQVEMGLTWYIIIMIVGTLFKERILLWVFATAYFFLWTNGFLNGGKK